VNGPNLKTLMKNPIRLASGIAILSGTMLAWGQESVSDVLANPAPNISLPADRELAVQRMRAIGNASFGFARAKANARRIPMRQVLPNGTFTETMGLDESG
jgi:hypothetical protein